MQLFKNCFSYYKMTFFNLFMGSESATTKGYEKSVDPDYTGQSRIKTSLFEIRKYTCFFFKKYLPASSVNCLLHINHTTAIFAQKFCFQFKFYFHVIVLLRTYFIYSRLYSYKDTQRFSLHLTFLGFRSNNDRCLINYFIFMHVCLCLWTNLYKRNKVSYFIQLHLSRVSSS